MIDDIIEGPQKNQNHSTTGSSALSPGLVYQQIPGDGHCLFHAVGMCLEQNAGDLRNIVANYLQENRAEFASYYAEENRTFDQHIADIRSGEEWGTHIEIEAIARIYQRPIVIIRPDANPTISDNVAQLPGAPIFLYYNQNIHYDLFTVQDGYDARAILATMQAQIAQQDLITFHPDFSSPSNVDLQQSESTQEQEKQEQVLTLEQEAAESKEFKKQEALDKQKRMLELAKRRNEFEDKKRNNPKLLQKNIKAQKRINKKQNKDKKIQSNETKTGLFGMVYTPKRVRDQSAQTNSTFNTALLKLFLLHADCQSNFAANVNSEVKKKIGKQEISTDLSGWMGTWNILRYAGAWAKDSTAFQKLHTVSHWVNPANHAYFYSLWLNEIVKNVFLIGLKKDENPGVMRMGVYSLFYFISGLQFYIISSACKPLVYARRSPKLFTLLVAISLAVLNSMVYAYNDKTDLNNEHGDKKLTLYEFYKKIAEDIFDQILVPYLGSLYPGQMSREDRNTTIESLTGFLVEYSAITLGTMASQLPAKAIATARGIKVIADSPEHRFTDAFRWTIRKIKNGVSNVRNWMSARFQDQPQLQLDLEANIANFTAEDPSYQVQMMQIPSINAGNDISGVMHHASAEVNGANQQSHVDNEIQAENTGSSASSYIDYAETDITGISQNDDDNDSVYEDAEEEAVYADKTNTIIEMFGEVNLPDEDNRQRSNTTTSVHSQADTRARSKSIVDWVGALGQRFLGTQATISNNNLAAEQSEIIQNSNNNNNLVAEQSAITQNSNNQSVAQSTVNDEAANNAYLETLADLYVLYETIAPQSYATSTETVSTNNNNNSATTHGTAWGRNRNTGEGQDNPPGQRRGSYRPPAGHTQKLKTVFEPRKT